MRKDKAYLRHPSNRVDFAQLGVNAVSKVDVIPLYADYVAAHLPQGDGVVHKLVLPNVSEATGKFVTVRVDEGAGEVGTGAAVEVRADDSARSSNDGAFTNGLIKSFVEAGYLLLYCDGDDWFVLSQAPSV